MRAWTPSLIPVSIAYSTQIIAPGQVHEPRHPHPRSATLWTTTPSSRPPRAAASSSSSPTFYNEGGDPEFDEGFKAWINADSENLTNNGGNDMIAAVSVMGYDAYNVRRRRH